MPYRLPKHGPTRQFTICATPHEKLPSSSVFISPKFNAVFVHCPKTGGASIYSVFQREDPHFIELRQHLRASEGQQLLPRWSKMFRFGVCRHPCDQLVSHYRHMRRDPFHQYFKTVSEMDFSRWLRWYTEGIGPVVCAWYLDAPMDYVIRFEGFESGLRIVFGKLGIPEERWEVPKLNAAPETESWRDYFAPDDLTYVLLNYRDDFTRFGYVV